MFHNNPSGTDELELRQKQQTLVCVTNQYRCERLIRAGRVVADLSNTDLNALHIASPSLPANGDALEHLFDVSKQNNAVMTVYYDSDSLKCLIRYIRENRVANVITGMPQPENSILQKLWRKFRNKNIGFYTVDSEGELHPVELKEV